MPEGGTVGNSLKAYLRDTGRRHPEDRDHIEPPMSLMYLYGWFWECAQGRPIGPEGVSMPIPSAEIAAWASLAQVRPQPWEMGALRALDGCFLRIASEKGT